MNIWMVGGAVRDGLLGLPVTDRDWVVTGQTPQAMLAAGYTPVGKDFPVFLHPDTKDEVALARTERKTAPGYRGFSFSADPSVTLEDDLSRRDLTINAMAQDAQGVITDPHGGQRDLALRLLRHVSPAFAEDPVRILRLARFAARFGDFTVAPETTALMQQMVRAGEVDALVSERVWQELSRGLMEAQPSRMFEVLRSCGALAKLLPEVDRLWRVPQQIDDVAAHRPMPPVVGSSTGIQLLAVLDTAARLQAPLTVRFACMGQKLGGVGMDVGVDVDDREAGLRRSPDEGRLEAITSLSVRLRVPVDCRSLAEVVARECGHIQRATELGAQALVSLLERCDALRRPQRWDQILMACECDASARAESPETVCERRSRLNEVRAWACNIESAQVAEQAAKRGLTGAAIGEAVHAARVAAVQRQMAS